MPWFFRLTVNAVDVPAPGLLGFVTADAIRSELGTGVTVSEDELVKLLLPSFCSTIVLLSSTFAVTV
ncbi:hypothetical protein D3C84_1180370 [compost metagenome]